MVFRIDALHHGVDLRPSIAILQTEIKPIWISALETRADLAIGELPRVTFFSGRGAVDHPGDPESQAEEDQHE